jgi:hypothetical protein
MATAQALGVDMSTLFGGRKMLDNASDEPQGKTDNEPPDDVPPADNTANPAADAAAADNEPDFPEDPEEKKTEFDLLTGTLQEYMSFKEYLDVTSNNGLNPYKRAQAELSSATATVESRSKMIQRLRDYLIAKHTPGVV